MTTPRHVDMAEDDFLARFEPIPNHLNADRGFDGCLFETFGEDLAFVRATVASEPQRVWTLVESDGVMSIESGYHHVNRLGYLVTRHPAEAAMTYSIVVEDLTEQSTLEPAPTLEPPAETLAVAQGRTRRR